MLMGLSHHRYQKQLVTCGEVVTLWDTEMRHPINEYRWGMDSVHSAKFNQVS